MKKYLVGFSLLLVATLFLIISSEPDDLLHIIACDVGQGDAILIIHQNDQILIDGGPNSDVINCLSRYVPFWDRKIEMVVLTHPQADHYAGLISVLRQYDVDTFMASQVDNSTQGYEVLKNIVGSEHVKVVNPHAGMAIRLGLIHLDVLNPSSEMLEGDPPAGGLGTFETKRDLNDFSVTLRLTYGAFSGLFTGDLGPNVSRGLVEKGLVNNVYYLKVPHHGSRNGLLQELLDAANPKLAVISVGKDNRFGHPHKEVLEMLNTKGVEVLRTDELGDVVIIADENGRIR